MRTRFVYLMTAMIVLAAGLVSRSQAALLPTFLAQYSGDTLWALMIFLLVSTLAAEQSMPRRAAVSLTGAYVIEISQLYHAPWIDSIRQTTLGGLVLGFGFLWTDLVCYFVGITLGALSEWSIRRLFGSSRGSVA